MIKQLQKYKLLILLFVSIELIITFAIYMNTQREISTFINNKTKSAEVEYKAVYSKVKEQAQMIFNESINTPTVINYFKNAYTRDKKQQAILRQELYKHLLPSYQSFKKSIHLRQIHFHLPDNKSFLRMHKVSKFGDDLTGIRATVEYVNKYKKAVDGFEEGRIKNGFRFVYPLFDDLNKYLGSVEVSFSVETFNHVLNNELHSSKFIILKSIVDQKVWQENLNQNYIESGISPLYLLDTTQFNDKNKDRLIKLRKKITPASKLDFSKKRIHNHSFSLVLPLEDKTSLLTFLPIKNPISGETVSYIILNSHIAIL